MYKRFFLIFIALIIFSCINGQTIIDDLTINPNPFQKRTSFTYSFVNNDTVSVNVLNVVANIIYSPITNSVMPSGIYQDSLIMDSFSDGIYFVQLTLGHRKTITKKIIKSNTAGIEINSVNIVNAKIYPNPFTGKLTVELPFYNNSIKQIKVFNNLGQCLYTSDNFNFKEELDLLSLPVGLYYLRVEGITEQKSFKIIKE